MPAHIDNHMIVLYGFFQNRDGLMILPAPTGHLLYRMVLTDSGHYLLPVDGSVQSCQDNLNQVSAAVNLIMTAASTRWKDVLSFTTAQAVQDGSRVGRGPNGYGEIGYGAVGYEEAVQQDASVGYVLPGGRAIQK